jgi:hypothetical protein
MGGARGARLPCGSCIPAGDAESAGCSLYAMALRETGRVMRGDAGRSVCAPALVGAGNSVPRSVLATLDAG